MFREMTDSRNGVREYKVSLGFLTRERKKAFCDGRFYVNSARLWCPIVWSNVNLDVAVKLSCRCISSHIYNQSILTKGAYPR